MKKIVTFLCCAGALFVVAVSPADAAKERKSKEPAEISIPTFNDDAYSRINEIEQQLAVTSRMNELRTAQLKGMELQLEHQKLTNELQRGAAPVVVAPPPTATEEKPQPAPQRDEPEVPVEPAFPMPGGNPVVKSAYMTHGKWEAELQIGEGKTIIVRGGDMLPGAYKVRAVGFSGVVLEKDGKTEVLPR